MIRTEVIKSISQLKSRQVLLKRCMTSRMYYTAKYSTKATEKDYDDELDKPVKYSTSKAANWPACGTGFRIDNKPEIQPVVIALSLGVFLLYFGVLREESDIDQKLENAMSPEAHEFFYELKKKQDKEIAQYRANK